MTQEYKIPIVETRVTKVRGRGLFALVDFDEGQTIKLLDIEREISADRPLKEFERADHVSFWDGRILLIGDPVRNRNHSCNPNCFVRANESNCDILELVARRPIAADEEVTLDYLINNPGGASWQCHCGASRCRGLIAGSYFDLPIEIQREYRPLLAEWFVAANRNRISALDSNS